MEKVISANNLITAIRDDPSINGAHFARIRRHIEDAPVVKTVEVAYGRWEQVQRWATKAKYRCSVCGREIMSAVKVNIEKYPYCHCGAKMDGGNEDG